MSANKPFGRSLALIAAISQVFAVHGRQSVAAIQLVSQLASSKQFQSRGHGRSKRSGPNVKALNKMYRQNSGKNYSPYSGAQEKLRRAARFVGDLTAAQVLLRRSWANAGESTPRRMWHAVDAQGYPHNLAHTTRRATLAVGHSAVLQ